jgi:hypothetical protein
MLAIRYDQVGLAAGGIGLVEAEDVLYDGWTRREAGGAGFVLHGRSLEGRMLALEVTLQGAEVHVLRGRALDEAERARYRRRRFRGEGGQMGKLPPRRVQTQVLGLRMDDETMRWLEEAAEREGVSANVLARQWVLERLGQEPPPASSSSGGAS